MADRAIIVEQLNSAQWHAVLHGCGARGVGSYVTALSDGLVWGALDNRKVETVALNGTRLLMSRATGGCEIRHG